MFGTASASSRPTHSHTHDHTPATVVAGLVFCPMCGNLLEVSSTQQHVKCEVCKYSQPSQVFEEIEVETRSRPSAFAAANRAIVLFQSRMGAKREEAATIQEKCPKCGNPEMTFHTMQLRSADEGQTVFYSCKKCGHKFSVNS
ncbi:DNA-directed RNA polymerase I core subunit rpa12 [Sorochytrium milnesiophthora]